MDGHFRLLALPDELKLEVCQYLEFSDLFRLSLVSRGVAGVATEVMYKRDARSGKSHAILWAASASGFSEDHGKHSIKILEYSKYYGGNVNAFHYQGNAFCTALHVAAAHGNKVFVEKLIEHGANINAYSLKLWRFLRVGRFRRELDSATILKAFAQRSKTQNYCWLPLLPAMFRYDPYVARILARGGSSHHLALHRRNIFVPPLLKEPQITDGYTIHHFLIDERRFPDLRGKLFCHFKESLALPERKSRMSPLMKAIHNGNEEITEILIPISQQLDMTSVIGWPALSYAVQRAATFDMPKKRDWSVSIVRALLNQGADPNIGQPSPPLEIAVTDLLKDSIIPEQKHMRRMRQIISDLLDHGASPNLWMRSGQTLGQFVFREIEKRPNTHFIRDILAEFLEKGLRLNILFPDGTSILGRALASSSVGPKLALSLLPYDPFLTPDECDSVLKRWARKDKSLPKEFKENLDLFAPRASQPAIDGAYTSIILDNNAKELAVLMGYRYTTRPSNLLATAIRHKAACREALFPRSFDPLWTNVRGQSYGHIIIEELGRGKYTEKEAIQDMTTLLARGLRLDIRDNEGQVVLQRLMQLPQVLNDEDAFPKLDRLIMRCRMKEQENEI
ncbi:hypothetical protein NLG97_g4898 [Lecanicillium saksenae]|uniref:Uncharacterized protein n=1 Tax=Lecanicillium saksenae TaxID=468837 RepID=A0ACC1QX58_9HYPO|nr:hypothetical protein NLG97_g4898 [Lecanicillium saksenae]